MRTSAGAKRQKRPTTATPSAREILLSADNPKRSGADTPISGIRSRISDAAVGHEEFLDHGRSPSGSLPDLPLHVRVVDLQGP